MRTLSKLHFITGTKNPITNLLIIGLLWLAVSLIVLTVILAIQNGINDF